MQKSSLLSFTTVYSFLVLAKTFTSKNFSLPHYIIKYTNCKVKAESIEIQPLFHKVSQNANQDFPHNFQRVSIFSSLSLS